MMVGTLTMAVMPPYASIGLTAPILILVARLVQGFAVGGELGSATAFMVEHSPTRRGYFASWQFASQGLAAILAAAFGSVLTAWMSPEHLEYLGLAHPVPVRCANRADRLLHPLASRRDARVSGDAPDATAGPRRARRSAGARQGNQ